MEKKSNLIQLIKDTVCATEPDATLILYGSYARGDQNDASDIDLLVVVDKESVTRNDKEG
ncbi:nucleotidyltransferase domain-containing protein [Persicitalea sp.]|uniref:nucleotidyltransferase domain-containing protein n=1 Tax=Persicitalea sp. TaxID=3100273 RepID=UPI003593A28B